MSRPDPFEGPIMDEIRERAAAHDFPVSSSVTSACTRCGFRLTYRTVTEIPEVCTP